MNFRQKYFFNRTWFFIFVSHIWKNIRNKLCFVIIRGSKEQILWIYNHGSRFHGYIYIIPFWQNPFAPWQLNLYPPHLESSGSYLNKYIFNWIVQCHMHFSISNRLFGVLNNVMFVGKSCNLRAAEGHASPTKKLDSLGSTVSTNIGYNTNFV